MFGVNDSKLDCTSKGHVAQSVNRDPAHLSIDERNISNRQPQDGQNQSANRKVSSKKNPPVKEVFHAWDSEEGIPRPVVELPEAHNLMGCKPVLGDNGPRPTEKQPSAKTSNAKAIPDLWEDRGHNFEIGGRYLKWIGEKPENGDELPDDNIDQQKALVLKLIGKKVDEETGRSFANPVVYITPNGVPKDWNDKQAIKQLNDRRREAIDRVTQDPPWTIYERQVLNSIIGEYPEGSIWEWTEHHNHILVGNYRYGTGIGRFMDLSDGRTVESVANEYRKFRVFYDRGESPPETTEVRRAHKNSNGQDIDVEFTLAFFRNYLSGEKSVSGKVKAGFKGEKYVPKRKRISKDEEQKANSDAATEEEGSTKKRRKTTSQAEKEPHLSVEGPSVPQKDECNSINSSGGLPEDSQQELEEGNHHWEQRSLSPFSEQIYGLAVEPSSYSHEIKETPSSEAGISEHNGAEEGFDNERNCKDIPRVRPAEEDSNISVIQQDDVSELSFTMKGDGEKTFLSSNIEEINCEKDVTEHVPRIHSPDSNHTTSSPPERPFIPFERAVRPMDLDENYSDSE